MYRLPFQNLCYRATVRVVDFFPPKLEDFSVSYDRQYPDSESSNEENHDSDRDMPTRTQFSKNCHQAWEWRFCLLVEDSSPTSCAQPKERLKLFVSGADAVHLLKLDAVK
jgi:protection of telomeres protein 1